MIDCPVVGVGDDRGWSHVLVNPLWEIQYLDLHGLMMALFPPVIGAVVVLVPVLNIGPAARGRIHYERHDRPLFADEPIACRDEPRGVEHLSSMRPLISAFGLQSYIQRSIVIWGFHQGVGFAFRDEQ